MLSERQQAAKGIAVLAGGLHVVLPHWTVAGGVIVGGFSWPIGPSPRSTLASEGGLFVAAGGDEVPELLLHAAATEDAPIMRATFTRLIFFRAIIFPIDRQRPAVASGATRRRVVTASTPIGLR